MKRKGSIIILTAILIGSFYHQIYAQGDTQDFYHYDANQNVAIAANGLNMRSSPNTKSTKLVNIPYGEKVNIIHKDHYGLDTVYTIKTELGDHPVYGHWQKVSYKEYTGYVHNSFLSFNFNAYPEPKDGINVDQVLLQPGYDCSYKFYNTNDYIWYGYYQEENGSGKDPSKSYKKQIEVEFITIANDMSGAATIVKEDRHLKFIIGTKKVFGDAELGNIIETSLYNTLDNQSIQLDSTVASQGKISMVKNEEPSNYYTRELFYLHRDETMQLINKVARDYRIKPAQYFIQADLDGDGFTDYIFGYGEDDFKLGLYLSSKANEEEVAHLVSILLRGPCC